MKAKEQKQLNEVLRWLDRRNAYIASAVVRLGEVSFTDRIETAAIRVEGRRVKLFFNREFYNSLKQAELAGVLVHEAFHFVFRHIKRASLIRNVHDKLLFTYACEAVINDIISISFPDYVLPLDPIRGKDLIGRDTAQMTAEQVMNILSTRFASLPSEEQCLIGCRTTDDHGEWDNNGGLEGWTDESAEVVREILGKFGGCDAYGSSPLGANRLFEKRKYRKNLKQFLLDTIKPSLRYHTLWNRFNRKAAGIYPEVILPTYEPDEKVRKILIAVDTSGSIPKAYLSQAMSVAIKGIPGNRIKVVTFDTRAYEYEEGSNSARGGGGTRIQSVEEHARNEYDKYPDDIICFSDCHSPKPDILHPERWVFLLPPYGGKSIIPKKSRIEYFEAA